MLHQNRSMIANDVENVAFVTQLGMIQRMVRGIVQFGPVDADDLE
jgi:hypothetical protein